MFKGLPYDVSHWPESSVLAALGLHVPHSMYRRPPPQFYSFSKTCFLTFMSEEAKASDAEGMTLQGTGHHMSHNTWLAFSDSSLTHLGRAQPTGCACRRVLRQRPLCKHCPVRVGSQPAGRGWPFCSSPFHLGSSIVVLDEPLGSVLSTCSHSNSLCLRGQFGGIKERALAA